MGELAWVRKYRPASFEEYMGDNVKNLVTNRFKDRKNIPNTIMLYGTRGTGKTSMARLLAKEIHCMSPVDGHSCGECDMCQQINEYITSTEAGVECYGITEIDAATTTGKSDINDIIEEALIPPMYPLEHKIVILDECHQLSKAAQNSLLKVIEEPPEHLIFILCTTDPEMVIGTIHSRMQLKIEVRKKSVEEMTEKLLEISTKEGLRTSKEALRIIAKKGQRIPRECINLLETVAKNNGNVVEIEQVRASIGDISNEIYVDFIKAARGGLEQILNFTSNLKEKDVNYKEFMNGLTRFVLDSCYIRNGVMLDDYSTDYIKKIKEVFGGFGSSELDMTIEIVYSANKEIGSDDTINELNIVMTAIRIGKVDMIAHGSVSLTSETNKENDKSTSNYRELVETEEKAKFEKIKDYGSSKTALSAIFKNMHEIRGETRIIEDSTNRIEDNNGDNLFLSKNELEGLL